MKDRLYITFLPTQTATPADNEQDMIIEGIFKTGDAYMRPLTIEEGLAGVYTSFTNDGSSGTLTVSKNGGSYATFTSPYVLEVGDTFEVLRTVDSADGWYKLGGTINTKILGFEFGAGELTSDEFTIDSSSAGTFTDVSQDGGSGTITFSKNGDPAAAFSNPYTLNAGDSIQAVRTTATAAGTIKLYGN